MLDVVFNHSDKVSLKRAINYSKRNIIASSILYIDEEPIKYNLIKNLAGKSLEGNINNVINIGHFLDLGSINTPIYSEARKDLYYDLHESSISFDEIDQLFSILYEDLQKLINYANKKHPIRIWKSNTAYCASSFAYVCNLLKDVDCKITVINLPEYHISSSENTVTFNYFSDVHPGEFNTLLRYEKKLSSLEKHINSNLWERLQEEDSNLRAIVNGKLISVEEDFYDHIILRNIPNHSFTMSDLISKIQQEYKLSIPDGWYSLRINKMIKQNKLQIINEDTLNEPLSKVLIKTKAT